MSAKSIWDWPLLVPHRAWKMALKTKAYTASIMSGTISDQTTPR